MCQEKNTRHFATNDIVVYKVMLLNEEGNICTPFRLKRLYFGEKNIDKLSFDAFRTLLHKHPRLIDKGFFHALSNKEDAFRCASGLSKNWTQVKYVVVKGRIPRHTFYFTGVWDFWNGYSVQKDSLSTRAIILDEVLDSSEFDEKEYTIKKILDELS